MLGKVLQWALKGAETYARLKGELPDCQAVKEATREHFDDVDTIGGWLSSSTTKSHIPEHDTSASAAFKHTRHGASRRASGPPAGRRGVLRWVGAWINATRSAAQSTR